MSFAARLADGPPLLLDGGMGSMLIARGLGAGEFPESWTLERGDEILAVHRAYVDAGSDALQTASFGAHPLRLAATGLAALAGRAGEIATVATRLARRAGARYVIGNVGPTGEFLPPVGRGEPEAFRCGFRELGRAFAAAGVDALHVETMSDLAEAQIALAALREAAPGTPVLVSLTFERRPRGFFTIMGDRLEAALPALAAAGATAVGANCTLTSADFGALAGAARTSWSGPLLLQPNAGAPRVDEGGVRYTQTPEEFAADMAAAAALAREHGGVAVGGCCGTDPRAIAALAAALARRGLR
jgi:5-methyltetrahydrofolate--homocysteine methyltransferase